MKVTTSIFKLLLGKLFSWRSDRNAREIFFESETALLAVRGTEFQMEVTTDGTTIVTLGTGSARLTPKAIPAMLPLEIAPLERVVVPADIGRPPRKESIGIETYNNTIQWVWYYPAVLYLGDAWGHDPLPADLEASAKAYARGSLPEAVAKYPWTRVTQPGTEMLYQATLLLSIGEIEQVEALLRQVELGAGSKESEKERLIRLSASVRKLIAAVKFQDYPLRLATDRNEVTATEWLAESYYQQSRATFDREALGRAKRAAQHAAAQAPNFGLAWARLAEMFFSFGEVTDALSSLDKALKISPEHPEARALAGFLFLANGKPERAEAAFRQAVGLDYRLANGWLGLGLNAIQAGHFTEGIEHLKIAVFQEPQRALLRSYLGKAYYQQADREFLAHGFQIDHELARLGEEELALAKKLDPGDPTPWLYSALIRRDQNQINDAVRALDRSLELHGNRALFRSQLLLDQDQAVQTANLANIYHDAGLTEMSLTEAASAAAYDFTNPAGHLFLADSLNALREPTRFNLRFETAWFNELLLGNILAPVGSSSLSQQISQQEYSSLFRMNGLGFNSRSEYRSDGQFQQNFSQYGHFDRTAYSIDGEFFDKQGVRPNNALSRLEVYATIKQQLSAQDSVLFLSKIQEFSSGDNFQRRDPSTASRYFHWDEPQYPGLLLAAYHREWSPGNDFMMLAGRLANQQDFFDRRKPTVYARDGSGNVIGLVDNSGWDLNYNFGNSWEIYSGELNQIMTHGIHTLDVGARFQAGTFEIHDQLEVAPSVSLPELFESPPARSRFTEPFNRASGYGYYTVALPANLWLTAGLAYDYLQYPENFRHPPFRPGNAKSSKLSPKTGLIWRPRKALTVRGIYAHAIGGASFDESVRLEPTQLAGFPQAFRTIIPESIVGSLTAPEYEIAGLALDLRIGPDTFVQMKAEQLRADVTRAEGAFAFGEGPLPAIHPIRVERDLAYQERSVGLSFNRLLGQEWAAGLAYRFSQSELDRELIGINPAAVKSSHQTDTAALHRARQFIFFNHRSGWFAGQELEWHFQNSDVNFATYHEEFPQLNFYGGYRFANQRARVTVALLNLTGEDYRLDPLTPYSELPRERTVMVRWEMRF